MSEIDLIPSDYRERLWHLRFFRNSGLLLVLIIALFMLLTGIVSYLSTRILDEVELLQTEKEITTRQRDQLEQLTDHKNELQRQLKLLSELRGGTTAEHIIHSQDGVLREDEVWFLDWKFHRDGEVIDQEQAAVSTGYFLVVPTEGKKNKAEAWQIKTHMTIRGQARDHEALSQFVHRLFSLSIIVDVRVLKTSIRRYDAVNVVDFDLAIIVNNRMLSG